MKILTLIALISTSLFAQDFKFDKKSGKSLPNYVGELKLFKGQVFKLSKGELKPVQAGTRFFKDESLVTKDKAFAKVIIVDDTVMSLGPNSELNFEDFKFQDKTNRHIVFSFIKGQLSGHITKKAKDGDIVVKTKHATMGIRGTEILVNHQTLNNLEISEFALLSGNVQVTDEKDQKHILKEADRIVLVHDTSRGSGASEQVKLSEEEFKELKAEGVDENQEFKPFMPYFELVRLSKDSPIYALLNGPQIEVTNSSSQASIGSGESERSMEKNLQKLNEELQKNQDND